MQSLNTPILFLIFNRPQSTKMVFEQIRAARPKQLFVAADGPRPFKNGEYEICKEVRRIATEVNWECELKTFFRDVNIGCGKAPFDAITWFFENVDEGIILEDDCLPGKNFFIFCQVMLEKYKNDEKIQSISGTNLLQDYDTGDSSYFFSFHSGIWGWATWKRAWMKNDYWVSKWGNPQVRKQFKCFFKNSVERDIYIDALENTFKKENNILDIVPELEDEMRYRLYGRYAADYK